MLYRAHTVCAYLFQLAETHWRCSLTFQWWHPLSHCNWFAATRFATTHTTATWETNLEEMKVYLGFMIVMGMNSLPEIRDYWSMDTKLNNTISSQITRKRFEEISQYLHFADNTTLPLRDEPGFHRLQKVMHIITSMEEMIPSKVCTQVLYNVHVHLLE